MKDPCLSHKFPSITICLIEKKKTTNFFSGKVTAHSDILEKIYFNCFWTALHIAWEKKILWPLSNLHQEADALIKKNGEALWFDCVLIYSGSQRSPRVWGQKEGWYRKIFDSCGKAGNKSSSKAVWHSERGFWSNL